uniref:1-phosphatidylinositol 4,5-bisphosphate phosphodiesterase gamma-1-like isoform X1 n=1 Tax=Styela clava TaxID=7725 RepID=UPI00193A4A1B|nr:1-phosphatidylinositol 4,5-bisphosphate phosphodiesterase gamma-1-like isoform X1 [Styela clava]
MDVENSDSSVLGIPKVKFHDGNELESVLRRIEMGNLMKKFSAKKTRSEDCTFQVNLLTRCMTWSRRNGIAEGSVNIREIKEIRKGKVSRDFERLIDESRHIDPDMCFIILYGQDFTLKLMSIAANNPEDVDVWIKGLSYLVHNSVTASYFSQLGWWLRREFEQINQQNCVTLRIAKAWLPTVNAKNLSTRALKEVFQVADINESGELYFDQFILFYNEIMLNGQMDIALFLQEYSSDGYHFNAQDFQKFLIIEQKDDWAQDIKNVENYMRSYFRCNQPEVCVSISEALSYLFSKENCVWDSAKMKLKSDTLNQPLSEYWISSSHNTYLTGDQFSSESSCEAYARCLRMGCRCIELDCWDGPDGMPCIFHGHTLTSKIKFIDVLKTIKEHAFVVSDLPVILSIENHCKLPQQRHMATMFVDVFGDMMVTQRLKPEETTLPTPNQLKGKIIIKHKKLTDDNRLSEVWRSDSDAGNESMDISNSQKNGLLYMEDKATKEWILHYFVLVENKLVYGERPNFGFDDTIENLESNNHGNDSSKNLTSAISELHYSENWYHGSKDRSSIERLLREYAGPDGSFVVRDSSTFIGNYTLSFWFKGRVHHCRIHSQQLVGGLIEYYLVSENHFDSLYSLICHYLHEPLKNESIGFELLLTDAVPQTNAHISKGWYYEHLDRSTAETILMRMDKDDVFLVRKSGKRELNTVGYTISFRAKGNVKHCKVDVDGRLYRIGNGNFETLCDIVIFYGKNSLYKNTKLRYPVTREIIESLQDAELYEQKNGNLVYVQANPFTVTVKSLFDYHADREDELSFCKHAIISNVVKDDGGWWRGDYGGKKGAWFPSNFVEEILSQETANESENVVNLLGELQKGWIDLARATVENVPAGKEMRRFHFRLKCAGHLSDYDLAAETNEDMLSWIYYVKEAIEKNDSQTKKKKDIEIHKRIAVEISDLVIYCQPVAFKEERFTKQNGSPYEMSSFPENKAERLACREKAHQFISYNQRQLSRIYPKGARVDSSNYNPIPMWNCGCQLVALNFQTPDKSMQLNQARFSENGQCGFVLKPLIFSDSNYNPYLKKHLLDVDPLVINVQIIAGRHLPKSGRGISCPFVEVEILGCEYDCQKFKTAKQDENGLNPVFQESFEFAIHCPVQSLIRFAVFDQDMFGDPNLIAQCTLPVRCLRTGFRSVPLKNLFSEELELASLLVHIAIRNLKKEDEELYNTVGELREASKELQQSLSALDPSSEDFQILNKQLCEIQKRIFSATEQMKERNIEQFRSHRSNPKV